MSSADTLFAGLMSGTSLDGVDAVLMDFSNTPRVIGTHFHAYPETLRQSLAALCSNGDNEIDRAGELDLTLGKLYADCINALLADNGVNAESVAAIGCHGQTIRHRPGDNGFSVQIGSADVLAAHTGIAVVNNFRNRDMVLGGQGAPLVPAFHADLFGTPGAQRAIVNIGGMANISLLDGKNIIAGYDTGPGNILLDSWYARYQSGHYDHGGTWAAQGSAIPSLLDDLLADPYFHQRGPKSTGREHFNLAWLQRHLAGDESAEDIQATLLELTAVTLQRELAASAATSIYVCGGGAHNQTLMSRLQALCAPATVTDTCALGIDPDWVEACAFAWLARARLQGVPGSVPCVTGARKAAVLGALYLP